MAGNDDTSLALQAPGQQLVDALVAAHVTEERSRLEKKIDEILHDSNVSYTHILDQGLFLPEQKPKVYQLMKDMKIDPVVKQELARRIVLRDQLLDQNLEKYINDVASIKLLDATIPSVIDAALHEGVLNQVMDLGSLGVTAFKEAKHDAGLLHDVLKIMKASTIIPDETLRLDAVALLKEDREQHGAREAYVLVHGLERVLGSLQRAAEYTRVKESVHAPSYSHGYGYHSPDLKVYSTFFKTLLLESRRNLKDRLVMQDQYHFLSSILQPGVYPSNLRIAQQNDKNLVDTLTYFQLITYALEDLPSAVKKAFYTFAGNSVLESKKELTLENSQNEKHPLALYFFNTLGLANQLAQEKNMSPDREQAIIESIQAVYRLEKKRKLSSLNRMVPLQLYRSILLLSPEQRLTYEKCFDAGLAENTAFGLASLDPLEKILHVHPAPAVEVLYAASLTTLRQSTWHYAIQMLQAKTEVAEKMLAVTERGLKLLPGGKT